MKKMFGILMLVVTLLSGITVLAQNSNSSTTSTPSMGRRHGRRHHRRQARRHRRHGRHATGNANKH
jgi:hypothetical protein